MKCILLIDWHINEGKFGDVRLDGLNLLALAAFEGNLWAGNTKATWAFSSTNAQSDRSEKRCKPFFAGQSGGWRASFAATIGEMRGIEIVPITFDIADDLASWSCVASTG